MQSPSEKLQEELYRSGKEERPVKVELKIPLSLKAIKEKIGGFMKRFLTLLTVVLMFGCFSTAQAIEMPDLSIDGYLLYDHSNQTTTAAPGISAGVFTAFNQILEGNIGVAFPSQNDDSTRDYVAGPILDVNLIKALERLKGVELVDKDMRLSVGIGVLMDIAHFNGSDPMKCIYPAAHLRLIF